VCYLRRKEGGQWRGTEDYKGFGRKIHPGHQLRDLEWGGVTRVVGKNRKQPGRRQETGSRTKSLKISKIVGRASTGMRERAGKGTFRELTVKEEKLDEK